MYTVHVYGANGANPSTWRDLDAAKRFAERMFNRPGIYKVKVWVGKPVPNVDKATNLLLHLV